MTRTELATALVWFTALVALAFVPVMGPWALIPIGASLVCLGVSLGWLWARGKEDMEDL